MLRCSATRAMTRTLHEPWPKHKRPPSARDPPSQSAAPQKTAESISRKPNHPLVDRGQRQQTPGLRAVLRRAGNRAQRIGIKVCPERNRHGEPPSFATLNQTCLKPTRPNRVIPSGTWYQPLRELRDLLRYRRKLVE